MTGERPPVEARQPSLPALELAGSLQGVILDVENNREFDLEFYQEGALYNVGTKLLDGETQGYIESATGSGKGLLIALIAEAAVAAGKRVHIMAPTIQVGDQLIEGGDGEGGMSLFTDLVARGLVKKNYDKKRGNKKSPVVVSSYQGVVEEQKAIERGGGRLGEFDVILGDECHMSLGTETVKTLYRYMPEAIKIGFSASPDYGEDRRSEEVWGSRWFEFSLLDLIDAEKASPIRPLLMTTESTIELTDYRKEFSERELAPLIDDFERNGLVLQLVQDFTKEGRQGIVFCLPGGNDIYPQNAHAQVLAQAISGLEANGRKIVAKSIGSHIDRAEQKRILDAYNRGEIDVLTSTEFGAVGWDSKKASYCINTQVTTSMVKIVQRMGRIARLKDFEGIFIDFVDKLTGTLRKDQYTGLHALGLEEVDCQRVLGWGESGPRPSRAGVRPSKPRDLSQYLRPELYARLMSVQGRTLRDVLVGRAKTATDPLAAHWERKLAEGETYAPPELPSNIVFSSFLARKYDRARTALMRDNGGIEPANAEVVDSLVGVTKEQRRVARIYGQQLAMESQVTIEFPDGEWATHVEADQPTEEEDPTYETVERRMLVEDLARTIDSLVDQERIKERDAGIIRFRYGIGREKPMTLDELTQTFDISRERVRQLEKKTLSVLRHPNHNQLIRNYVGFAEAAADTEEPEEKKSYFPKIPNVSPKEFDSYEAYADHLLTMAKTDANIWLAARRDELKDFMSKDLKDKRTLQEIAERVTPLGYEYNGRFVSADAAEAMHFKSWQVPKVYDPNELRARGLIELRDEVDKELAELVRIERRVDSRPTAGDIHGSLDTTKQLIYTRTVALMKYRDTLTHNVNRYQSLTRVEEPDRITFRWGLGG